MVAEQRERASILFGAAEALPEAKGVHLATADQAEYDRRVAVVRGQLDEETFKTAWAEGRAMTIDDWRQIITRAFDGTLA